MDEIRAWVITLIEIVGIGVTYFGFCWLVDNEPTIGGFALAVAIIALLGVTRLNTERK